MPVRRGLPDGDFVAKDAVADDRAADRCARRPAERGRARGDFARAEVRRRRGRRVRGQNRQVRRRRAEIAVGVKRAHGERVAAIGGQRDGRDLTADDALGLAVLEEQVADERPAVGGAGLPGERGRGVGHARGRDQRRALRGGVGRGQLERGRARAFAVVGVDRRDFDLVGAGRGEVREAHRATGALADEAAVAVDAVADDARRAGFRRGPPDGGGGVARLPRR